MASRTETVEHWIANRRDAETWRHPSDLSVLAWLFAGEGASLKWLGGQPSDAGTPEDHPFSFQIENAFLSVPEGLPPDAAAVFTAARSAAEALKASDLLHPLDRCISPDFLASRVPPSVDPGHAAGLMTACLYLSETEDLIPPHGRTREDTVRALVFSAAAAAVALSMRGQASVAEARIRELARRHSAKRGPQARTEPDLIFEDTES